MEARLISPAGAASLSGTEIRDAAARDDGPLWLDFDHSDEEGMTLLGELIDVRPSDIQECHNRSPVPKMRFYADHHFSAINGLARGADGRLRFQPLKLFLTPRMLVTVLGPTSSSLTSEIARRELAAVRQRIDSGQLRPASSFELVGAIRAEEMRTHENLITESSARIGQLERDVSQKDPVKAEALLQDLFDLRHDLEAIRTSAAQAAESFANLIETMELQEGLMRTDLRLVRNSQQGFRHLQHTADLEREYLQELIDLFQTRVHRAQSFCTQGDCLGHRRHCLDRDRRSVRDELCLHAGTRLAMGLSGRARGDAHRRHPAGLAVSSARLALIRQAGPQPVEAIVQPDGSTR